MKKYIIIIVVTAFTQIMSFEDDAVAFRRQNYAQNNLSARPMWSRFNARLRQRIEMQQAKNIRHIQQQEELNKIRYDQYNSETRQYWLGKRLSSPGNMTRFLEENEIQRKLEPRGNYLHSKIVRHRFQPSSRRSRIAQFSQFQ